MTIETNDEREQRIDGLTPAENAKRIEELTTHEEMQFDDGDEELFAEIGYKLAQRRKEAEAKAQAEAAGK